ncbi:GD10583 [Drosophila simulans]|uniref:GD10583 n=1 Tax=Drosophila simulans TaxID=7240 RepID=B4QG61_DROSI|nr:GD10583 [Drosophila simulans]
MDDMMRSMDCLKMAATFHNAALASTTCSGRTLGEDREPIWVEGSSKTPEPPLPEESPAPEPKNEIPLLPQIDFEPNISCFPDLQDINASIVRRELAEEGKRCVRQQLKAIKDKQDALRMSRETQQRKEERQSDQLQQKALRERNESLLIQKADQMTAAQLEAQHREQSAQRQQIDQKLHKLALEGVSRCQRRFNQKYEGIAKILLSLDQETVKVCAAQNAQLKELGQKFATARELR